ncbi:MAG: MATE family efflux transporter [Flavobacteriales bacterium]|nr:MATE family efflux transporter [Flavobacteriales bacterium]
MSFELNTQQINKLAIPAILYNITEPLIGLADTAIIGQMPEHATQAQGGVGLAVGLIMTLVWGLAQVRTAVSAIISKYLGMGKLNEIKSLIPQSLAFSLLLGGLFWLLTSFYYGNISDFLFQEDNQRIKAFSASYYNIRAMGLPLSLFIAGVFGVFRGYQNTSWAMVISFIGGIANIVLDLILVNGIEGLVPAYGVEGAAIASVIAQLMMAILCVVYLLNKTPFNLKLRAPLNHEFSNMFWIAMNMLTRSLALNVTFILALRYASGYGEKHLAAYTIGINIWLFTSFFIDGYSNAGNALAGKFLGANDNKNLNRLGWKLMFINLKIAIGLSIVYFASYPFMSQIFNSDPEVQQIFNSFYWLVILAIPINSIAYSFDGVFKGLGEAKFLRNILIVGTFIIFIPVLLLMNHLKLDLFSIWIAFVAWMLWRAISLVVKFSKLVNDK